MANTKKFDAVWTTFSVNSKPVLKAKEAAVRKAMEALKSAKAEFEAAVTPVLCEAIGIKLDDKTELRFGYNYGQLSYAVVAKGDAKAKSAAVDL